MRALGTSVLVFLTAFIAVGLLSGQQPFGGFGGGFGGPGGQGLDPLTLVRLPQVKKELDITEEQMDKLPDAVLKALGEVLSDKQLKRLKEIELQQRGPRAFSDPKIQKSLKFSQEQRDNVVTILDDAKKDMAELKKGGGKGFDPEVFKKLQAMNTEVSEKLTNVLTAEQKRSWKQMQGDEFKLEFGFGKGGGKKGKKKDDL